MNQRIFLQLQYDGTAFHGSQIQGTLPTVQKELEEALKILLKAEVHTIGASRTDEGVHALSNYFHFDLRGTLPPNFQYQLNALLPQSIAVSQVAKTTKPIHARFDALARTYRYQIYRKKNPFFLNRALYYPFALDQEILKRTADILLRTKNFKSFCKRNAQNHTYNCEILESYWIDARDQLHYVVRANRFLRGMVRGLVATQLKAARKHISIEEFNNIILLGDCTKADFSVSGHGLYLAEIRYPEDSLEIITDLYHQAQNS